MASRQLRLFPSPQPLVDRLGVDFFRELPQGPGVYWFADAAGRLLYVGKARNLRNRLNSYRRTEGQPRRTICLVHAAAFIRWEACASEATALEREAELIQTYQPRFNRAGKGRGRRPWVWLRCAPDQFEVWLAEDAPADPSLVTGSGQPFGYSARPLFVVWLRLMTLALEPDRAVLELPRSLLHPPGPRHWTLKTSGVDWSEPLLAFLDGYPVPLITFLEVPRPAPASAFETAWWTADMARLREGMDS